MEPRDQPARCTCATYDITEIEAKLTAREAERWERHINAHSSNERGEAESLAAVVGSE